MPAISKLPQAVILRNGETAVVTQGTDIPPYVLQGYRGNAQVMELWTRNGMYHENAQTSDLDIVRLV
jgi:hypothetical protein